MKRLAHGFKLIGSLAILFSLISCFKAFTHEMDPKLIVPGSDGTDGIVETWFQRALVGILAAAVALTFASYFQGKEKRADGDNPA
jgi:hypothetical protein